MPGAPREHDLLFYDGYCALCHGWVKRVMKHDREGEAFRFAALQGTTIRQVLSDEQREGLPDSIVVVTPAGEVKTRAAAVVHITDRLGRPPGLFLLTLAMRAPLLGDALYRLVAKTRHRVFGRTDEACPLMPPELRPRFLP